MPSVKQSDNISRNKTSPPNLSNGHHLLVLELLVGKWGSKEIVACYAGQGQGENDHHLAHAVNVMGNIQSATAAQINWERKTSISSPS